MVQPDLMVICDLEENLNEKDYYMGAPALVVEIISESTRSKDFIKKLDLYMSTGIKEYWIINPLNREVCVYLFEENNISQNATYKNHEKKPREGLHLQALNLFMTAPAPRASSASL